MHDHCWYLRRDYAGDIRKGSISDFWVHRCKHLRCKNEDRRAHDQTKRWRVNKYAMEAQMGTQTFTHAMLPALSRYVMVNKTQDEAFILAEIERVFAELYDKDNL